jgi:hypothetical protein
VTLDGGEGGSRRRAKVREGKLKTKIPSAAPDRKRERSRENCGGDQHSCPGRGGGTDFVTEPVKNRESRRNATANNALIQNRLCAVSDAVYLSDEADTLEKPL